MSDFRQDFINVRFLAFKGALRKDRECSAEKETTKKERGGRFRKFRKTYSEPRNSRAAERSREQLGVNASACSAAFSSLATHEDPEACRLG